MSLEKQANEIRAFCEQGKYRQVLEFFDKSADIVKRIRDNSEMALKLFDPAKHTLGYLLVMKYKFDGIRDPEAFLNQLSHLAAVFHPEQARKMIGVLAHSFHMLTSILIDRKQPQRGLLPLLTAIRRLRESPAHLTSLHSEYLSLCLASKNLPAALPLLDVEILNLNYEVSL